MQFPGISPTKARLEFFQTRQPFGHVYPSVTNRIIDRVDNQKVCPKCGASKVLMRNGARQPWAWFCRDCKNAARRERKKCVRFCVECGTAFVADTYKHRDWCSSECRQVQNFQNRVAYFRTKVAVNDSGCWNWTGSHVHGRPRFGGRTRSCAYRFSYELAHGEIPTGFHVHHLCGNGSCVNPEHLTALAFAKHLRLHAAERRGYRPGFDTDDWMWAA
jgi:hypothetical protein